MKFNFKKNLFANVVVIVCFITFLMGFNLPYKPTVLVSIILWAVIAPVIAFIFFYLTYFKNDSRFYITEWKRERKKWVDKLFPPPVCIILLSGVLAFIIWCNLALATDLLARHQFYQAVIVDDVRCSSPGRRSGGALYLNVTTRDVEQKKFHVKLPYKFCSELPIRKLIYLKGRRWLFGTIYEGFE